MPREITSIFGKRKVVLRGDTPPRDPVWRVERFCDPRAQVFLCDDVRVLSIERMMSFKFLPATEIAWSDVWIGATVAALLLTIGKALIGVYLVRSTVASAYGAAASLVILLVWVYYSAQILLLGAEVTQVYANLYGSRVEPVVPQRDSTPR